MGIKGDRVAHLFPLIFLLLSQSVTPASLIHIIGVIMAIKEALDRLNETMELRKEMDPGATKDTGKSIEKLRKMQVVIGALYQEKTEAELTLIEDFFLEFYCPTE